MSSLKHIPELDGIRGLAISLILVYHCLPETGGIFSRYIYAIKHSCWIGVDLFFVLSGFLITRILISLKTRKKKYIVFYARRSLRIFPLYYFSLILIFFVFVHHPIMKAIINYSAPMKWFFLYGYNIYVFVNNSFAISDFLNHFWSLCIEEQFYLVWPFIVFRLDRERMPLIMLLFFFLAIIVKVVLYLNGMRWPVIYTSTLARMDCFALGGLAAYATLFWKTDQCVKVYRPFFYISLLVLMLSALIQKRLILNSYYTMIVLTPIIAICFSSSIYLIIQNRLGFLRPITILSPLRFLGKYSYAIYVYHWLIYIMIARFDIFGMHLNNPWLEMGVVIAVTLCVSVASYYLLEKPFLNIKKYF